MDNMDYGRDYYYRERDGGEVKEYNDKNIQESAAKRHEKRREIEDRLELKKLGLKKEDLQ